MTVWAISDPHLSFGIADKSMEVFGPLWADYTAKMEKAWRERISPEDLILIPGDISWAMKTEDAIPDLKWIDALPGTKLIIKGNHDFWWSSPSKISKVMPPSIYFIQNNAFLWKGIAFGGSRLWDTEEFGFGQFSQFQENPRARTKSEEEYEKEKEEACKIFNRELERLKLSLNQLDPAAKTRIALTHYPPIGANLQPSRASSILEEYRIDYCVFGHLHSLNTRGPLFGEARGVKYILASCDYLDFTPIKIL